MKTNLKKLFLLAIILWAPNLVNAASSCSYEEQAEINNIVANVKADYEVVDIYDGKVYDVDNPDAETLEEQEVDHYIKGFEITILNITNDIYVKIKNNRNNEEKTFKYADTKDGTVTFQTTKKNELITYTVEVYSNKYSCLGEKFRELSFTTPMYNRHSQDAKCRSNSEFYYCQDFINSENISLSEFNKKITEYEKQKQQEEKEQQEQKNKSFIEKIEEFYNNNKIIIYVMIVIIVVTGVTTTVILVKKKRSRVL